MKKLCLTALLLALLCLMAATMAACSKGDGSAETDTADGTTAETTTSGSATALPRYDYFAADVLANVDVEKADYENMTFELPSDLQVTQAQVEKYVKYLRYQEREATNGDTKVTDQPLKLGDSAFIYYKGTIDGVAFDGGSNMDSETPHELGLGSGNFIDGFEDGLVGLVPNTTSKDAPFALHVTFPESYGKAELAGKDAIFYVVVEYAVQYDLPEYTRKFVEETLKFEAQKEHVTDGSYLAEFEEYVKTYLEEQNASYVDSAKTDKLWSYLTDKLECKNLPEEELTYYRLSYANEITSAYQYYSASGGDSFKQIYPTEGDFAIAYLGLEAGSNWEEELEKITVRMVKKDMIIHAIAELEGVETVADEELEEEIQYWIDYYGGTVTKADILENIGEDYLKESAFAVKMYDFLIDMATFTYGE